MKRWLYVTLIVIFSLVFLVSGFFLVRYFLASRKQQSQFDELAQLVAQVQTDPAADIEPADTSATQTDPSDPFVTLTDPDTGVPVQVLRQYAKLYERNNHLIGWMCIEDTKINYPVMQTPDSKDYYLKRDFNREYSEHGCLYVQENCNVSTSDNLIIYGHNMRDGSMFAALQDYKKESFYKTHPRITFNTLTEYRTYEILSVFYTTASEGQGFAYYQFTDAADETAFHDFVSTCKKLSIYDTGVTAAYGDKLITLSTCEYSQANGRLVVVAKYINN